MDGDKATVVPIWLLGMITFSGTMAMYIFVPALPMAAKDLGVGGGVIQLTISLYILGLAFGQLIYGPISDRFGRRPVLMAGLIIYALSGLGAALAPGINALIVARLLQAIGGCSGLVLARAIVRDTSAPREVARRLALMNLMVTLGPGAAPIVGGLIAEAFGWRSIFVLLCLFGMTNLALTWRLLPETAPRTGASGVSILLGNYLSLLKSGSFLGYAVGGGCATTAVYAFISAAPFIFVDQLHTSRYAIGIYLAVLVSGIWLGSILTSRLITRVSINGLLVASNAVAALAAFVYLAIVLAQELTPLLAIGPMFVFAVGVGIASPTALTQAVSVNPHIVGSAAGLYGFTQMVVGALCTALAGFGHDPALAAAVVLSGAGVVSQLAFFIAGRCRAAGT